MVDRRSFDNAFRGNAPRKDSNVLIQFDEIDRGSQYLGDARGGSSPYPYVPGLQPFDQALIYPGNNNTKLLAGCRLVACRKWADGGLDSTTQNVELVAADKGKPLVRGGRKTTGLPESAGSPK
jgi:hypothetical protein